MPLPSAATATPAGDVVTKSFAVAVDVATTTPLGTNKWGYNPYKVGL